ncbi:hypothetical protein [Nocardia sp. AG03]|uniref:hypothetical protein n=1 Tax=Nocardia sp. AG03 TaxID=3025312 RepID=UPI0024181E65|nr:hypothetical protein [Nocardia sp. AG03]
MTHPRPTPASPLAHLVTDAGNRPVTGGLSLGRLLLAHSHGRPVPAQPDSDQGAA